VQEKYLKGKILYWMQKFIDCGFWGLVATREMWLKLLMNAALCITNVVFGINKHRMQRIMGI